MPQGIVYEFELKDCHHDCQNCHLEQDFKNSGGNNNFGLVSANSNKEKLEKKLVEAKSQGNKKEIERIQSELEKLSNHQQREETRPEKNNSVLIWSVGIFSASALVLGVILIIKRKNKR